MAKAPQPKMAEFADAELILSLAGGLGKKLKAKITAEPILGKYGWQVPFAAKGQEFVRTMRENSRAYKTLFDGLGDDFADWVEQSVTMHVEKIEEGEFKGQNQIVFSV